jgi:hypothetical protein
MIFIFHQQSLISNHTMRLQFRHVLSICLIALSLIACNKQPKTPANTNNNVAPTTPNVSTNTANNADTNATPANKALPPPKPETVLLQKPTAQLTPAEIKQVITRRANEALSLLVKHDYQKLEPYIHPQKGLRFSPYAHVDLKNDIVISGQQLARAASEPRKYQWGYYDGSGEPMKFTINDYFSKHLIRKDFYRNATKIGYNEVIGTGNSINNRNKIYPNTLQVEYYMDGSEKYGGMDWQSICLVFELYENQYYLVGIINNQWTS